MNLIKIANELERRIQILTDKNKTLEQSIEKMAKENKSLSAYKEEHLREAKAIEIATSLSKKGFISSDQIEKTAEKMFNDTVDLDQLDKVAQQFTASSKQVGSLTGSDTYGGNRDQAFCAALNN